MLVLISSFVFMDFALGSIKAYTTSLNNTGKVQSAGDLTIYENLSLLSLTTLYGIELLEDNAQKCVINIFETFHEDYKNFANSLDKKTKFRVKESAKLIITTNIVEGNFLTKLTNSNKPIVFSEWRVVESKSNCKNIKIDRTEFSLDEIINEEDKDSGSVYEQKIKPFQISFFDLLENNSLEEKEEKEYKYKTVKILDLYKEDMEEITYEYAIDK